MLRPTLRPIAAPLHKRLRLLREARGLLQRELSDRLGRSQAYVSNVERGERQLDVIELHQWLTALGEEFMDFVRQIDDELRKPVTPEKPTSIGPSLKRRKHLSKRHDVLQTIRAMSQLVEQARQKAEPVEA